MLIKEPAVLSALLRSYGDAFALDTETEGVAPPGRPSFDSDALRLDRARVITISGSGEVNGEEVSFAVPFGDKYGSGFMSRASAMRVLREHCGKRGVTKIFHNANYDRYVLGTHGVEMAGWDGKETDVYCSMVAAQNQNPNQSASLKDLATTVGMMINKTKTVDFDNSDEIAEYAEADALATWRIYKEQKKGFKGHNRRLFDSIEMPLSDVLQKMQRRGALMDEEAYVLAGNAIRKELAASEAKLFEMAGKAFNPRSTDQVQKVLYEDFKIKPSEGSELPSGGFSTGDRALRFLINKHPIVPALLDYRGLAKQESTYLGEETGLWPQTDTHGYLHGSLNQSRARTNRMSSSLPNMQNIPSHGDIGHKIRSMFVAPEGYGIITADYKTMEIIMLANWLFELLGPDDRMVQVIRRGEDVHSNTAKRCSCDRGSAKQVNFGVIYGMMGGTLQYRLAKVGVYVTMDQAATYVKDFLGEYPGINEMFLMMFAEHEVSGHVHYMSGREREIENMDSPSFKERNRAERQLRNALIQGSCADWMKLAMVRGEFDSRMSDLGIKMFLQVHDELVFYYPLRGTAHALQCKWFVNDVMTQPFDKPFFESRLPLPVDVGFGINWGASKP